MTRRIQLALVALMLVAGCGEKISRDLILTRTYVGLQAAQVAFTESHHRRLEALRVEANTAEEAIKNGATSAADAQAKLAAYRLQADEKAKTYLAKADKVAVGFVVAFTAVSTASFDFTEAAVAKAVMLAVKVIDALRELGILPGGAT